MGIIRLAIKVFLLVFLVVFIAIAIHSWLLYKSYVFSQESVADVTSKAIAKAKSGGWVHESPGMNNVLRARPGFVSVSCQPVWNTAAFYVTI